MFIVDAISSLTRSYIYVGLTDNFDRRFSQHNNGYNKTTKPYRPFEVLLVESFNTRTQARKREKFLKSGQGKVLLKKVKQDQNLISRSKNDAPSSPSQALTIRLR